MGASTRAGRRALQSTDSGPCNLASYTANPPSYALVRARTPVPRCPVPLSIPAAYRWRWR